jgi:hypothetical protein
MGVSLATPRLVEGGWLKPLPGQMRIVEPSLRPLRVFSVSPFGHLGVARILFFFEIYIYILKRNMATCQLFYWFDV